MKKVAFALTVVVLAASFFGPGANGLRPNPLQTVIASLVMVPAVVGHVQAATVHPRNPNWIVTAQYRDPYYDMLRILAAATAGVLVTRAFAQETVERAYEAARDIVRNIRERGRDR